MFAIPERRWLLGRAALSVGLTLAGLGFPSGVAAAFPSQPAPADNPFLVPSPDPSTVLPTAPGTGTLLTNGVNLVPVLKDATSFLSAGQGPSAYLADFQAILNDTGALLGAPNTSTSSLFGVPNTSTSSLLGVPNTSTSSLFGVPNTSSLLSPVPDPSITP
jgi:hypothetical protein